MRDLLLAVVVFGSLPFILARPFIGILMLNWISLMNPHRLAYGWAYSFPWAQVLGVATIVSFIIALPREKQRVSASPLTFLLVALALFTTFTTLFALQKNQAWLAWNQFSKIILISLLTVAIVRTKEQLRWLMLLIVFSIGFYGVKGGVFSLLTGGRSLVLGPPNSFIASNNPLALALNMVIPICLYLGRLEPKRYLRWLLYVTAGFSAISVIFTYSRGGLLGLVAVVVLMAAKSKLRIGLVCTLAVFLGVAFWIAPEKWFARQETTLEYEQDASAVSRLNAWQFAWRIALRHPFIGLGFRCHTPRLYAEYFPESRTDNDFHSIYFGMLGEHGFPGLFLFLLLLLACLAKLRGIGRATRETVHPAWYASYTAMIEISIVGYIVSGTFLAMQYFDLFYTLVAVVIILDRFARSDLQAHSQKKHEAFPLDEPHMIGELQTTSRV
jgi:probable O-glycosylation ligase (exosortase A-associated)